MWKNVLRIVNPRSVTWAGAPEFEPVPRTIVMPGLEAVNFAKSWSRVVEMKFVGGSVLATEGPFVGRLTLGVKPRVEPGKRSLYVITKFNEEGRVFEEREVPVGDLFNELGKLSAVTVLDPFLQTSLWVGSE